MNEPKTNKRKFGKSVRVQVYIPPELYDQLKKHAPEYETHWETALFRQIAFEWLKGKKK